MNKTIAIVTLSNAGAALAAKLACEIGKCDLFAHRMVSRQFRGERFDAVVPLTIRIFNQYRALVFIMPAGVVVRAVDKLLKHKKTDPAVVLVDVGGRYAISLLSGHEGGANALALNVANILAAEPVISTTTEALKDLIIGIGCRRGVKCDDIVAAVNAALRRAHMSIKRVRLLASADLKKSELGLIAAAKELKLGLRFISSGEIRSTAKTFRPSLRHSSRDGGRDYYYPRPLSTV